MALTATNTTLSSGGLLTVSGVVSGGTLAVGMTFTNAAITEPTSPAAAITSLGSGIGGTGTYNTNLNQAITSSTFTFQQWEAPQVENTDPVPQYNINSGKFVVTLLTLVMEPPPPLPQSLFGSTTQTSYST